MTIADTRRNAETSLSSTVLYSDEPEMESSLHYLQLMLLVSCLSFYWRDRNDYFLGANLTIYYSRYRIRNRDSRGPDFFLVKNTDNRLRPSWVVWEEGDRFPNLIIELLSPSTANVDRTEKKQLYQNRFRTPEYFWFHPETLEFAGWRLQGDRYTEIVPNERGWRWSEELELYLGAIDGKLRYIDAEGNVIPTLEENSLASRAEAQDARAEAQDARAEAQDARAEAQDARAEAQDARAEVQDARAEVQDARARAQAAEIRAETAEAEANRLAQRLRELGIDPHSI